MKAGWEVKRLGEVAKLHYGKALAKAERNPEGGVPVYGANGILGWSCHVLTEGPSLIVGRKGSAGEVNRVDGPFWPSDVTYYTEHDHKKLDFDYFHYGMLTLNLPTLAKGVKPGINRNEAYALDFPLPPLDEQKRIIAILDAAFDGLARARANVEANLKNAREVFESYLYQEINSRAVKAGWEVKRLGEVAKLHYGKALAKAERNPEGGVPVYGANGILGWSCHVLTEGPSLIVGRKGSAGEVNRVDGPFWPSDVTYYTEHDHKKLDFDYFHYGMLTLNLPTLAKGVKPGINRNEAYALDFPLPPLDEQKRIIAILDAALNWAKQIEAHYQSKLANLEELRQSLLQKAFAGELT